MFKVLVAPPAEADHQRAVPSRTQSECQGVAAFERRDDTLQAAQFMEGRHRLGITDSLVTDPADAVQETVLRTHAGVVQPGTDAVHRFNLAVVILQQEAQ